MSPLLRFRLIALVVLAIAAQVGAGSPTTVLAHARLKSSNPVSGSALPTVPESIHLEFTEPIDDSTSRFRLIDPAGTTITTPVQAPTEDKDSVELTVATNDQPVGVYSLLWDVTSTTDGHSSSGSILFSVGTGRAPTGVVGDSDTRSPWWQILIRALWLASLGVIIAILVSRPPILSFVGMAAGILGLVAAFGSDAVAPPIDEISTSGRLQMAAGVLTLIGGICTVIGNRSPKWRLFAVAAWVGAIILLAASGHAAGTDRPAIAITIDAIHMLVAIGWFGILLAMIIRIRMGHVPEFGRFSILASVGLVLVIATGLISAAIQIPDQRSITDSTYGVSLSVKIVIAITVLAIAATNRWIVPAWIAENEGRLDRQSRWLFGTEAALLLIAILMGAVLSNTSPPDPYGVVQVAAPVQTVDQRQTTSDLVVTLFAQISGTVDDLVFISLAKSDGSTLVPQRVIVETSTTSGGGQLIGERFDATPIEDSPGSYSLPAVRLGVTSIWNIAVIVRQAGLTDSTATFSVDTTGWTVPAPRSVARAWTLPVVPIAGLALVLLAVVVALGGAMMVRRQKRVAPLSGGIIFLALAMIATGFIIQAFQRSPPRTSGHELVMPSATDPIAAGADYELLCLSCHGPNGGGLDTIDPNHQHGSGTDLLDERTRTLSDGDLFTILSNGTVGTDMPAFDLALTEQQRWDLVAYLRELQSNSNSESSATPAPQ